MAKDKLVSPSFCYILAANFLLYFAFYLIMPILPFYLQEQFGADKSMIGFILSCYTIAALSIRPFSGYLLDTFARRPLYLLAYSVFMVADVDLSVYLGVYQLFENDARILRRFVLVAQRLAVFKLEHSV